MQFGKYFAEYCKDCAKYRQSVAIRSGNRCDTVLNQTDVKTLILAFADVHHGVSALWNSGIVYSSDICFACTIHCASINLI